MNSTSNLKNMNSTSNLSNQSSPQDSRKASIISDDSVDTQEGFNYSIPPSKTASRRSSITSIHSNTSGGADNKNQVPSNQSSRKNSYTPEVLNSELFAVSIANRSITNLEKVSLEKPIAKGSNSIKRHDGRFYSGTIERMISAIDSFYKELIEYKKKNPVGKSDIAEYNKQFKKYIIGKFSVTNFLPNIYKATSGAGKGEKTAAQIYIYYALIQLLILDSVTNKYTPKLIHLPIGIFIELVKEGDNFKFIIAPAKKENSKLRDTNRQISSCVYDGFSLEILQNYLVSRQSKVEAKFANFALGFNNPREIDNKEIENAIATIIFPQNEKLKKEAFEITAGEVMLLLKNIDRKFEAGSSIYLPNKEVLILFNRTANEEIFSLSVIPISNKSFRKYYGKPQVFDYNKMLSSQKDFFIHIIIDSEDPKILDYEACVINFLEHLYKIGLTNPKFKVGSALLKLLSCDNGPKKLAKIFSSSIPFKIALWFINNLVRYKDNYDLTSIHQATLTSKFENKNIDDFLGEFIQLITGSEEENLKNLLVDLINQFRTNHSEPLNLLQKDFKVFFISYILNYIPKNIRDEVIKQALTDNPLNEALLFKIISQQELELLEPELLGSFKASQLKAFVEEFFDNKETPIKKDSIYEMFLQHHFLLSKFLPLILESQHSEKLSDLLQKIKVFAKNWSPNSILYNLFSAFFPKELVNVNKSMTTIPKSKKTPISQASSDLIGFGNFTEEEAQILVELLQTIKDVFANSIEAIEFIQRKLNELNLERILEQKVDFSVNKITELENEFEDVTKQKNLSNKQQLKKLSEKMKVKLNNLRASQENKLREIYNFFEDIFKEYGIENTIISKYENDTQEYKTEIEKLQHETKTINLFSNLSKVQGQYARYKEVPDENNQNEKKRIILDNYTISKEEDEVIDQVFQSITSLQKNIEAYKKTLESLQTKYEKLSEYLKGQEWLGPLFKHIKNLQKIPEISELMDEYLEGNPKELANIDALLRLDAETLCNTFINIIKVLTIGIDKDNIAKGITIMLNIFKAIYILKHALPGDENNGKELEFLKNLLTATLEKICPGESALLSKVKNNTNVEPLKLFASEIDALEKFFDYIAENNQTPNLNSPLAHNFVEIIAKVLDYLKIDNPRNKKNETWFSQNKRITLLLAHEEHANTKGTPKNICNFFSGLFCVTQLSSTSSEEPLVQLKGLIKDMFLAASRSIHN